jgi:hypothetical protein
MASVSDEKFVKAWTTSIDLEGVAKKTGLTKRTIEARARKLAQLGVELPRYSNPEYFGRSMLDFLLLVAPNEKTANKWIDRGFRLWRKLWADKPCTDKTVREAITHYTNAKTADRVCKEGFRRWETNPRFEFSGFGFYNFLQVLVLSGVPEKYLG